MTLPSYIEVEPRNTLSLLADIDPRCDPVQVIVPMLMELSSFFDLPAYTAGLAFVGDLIQRSRDELSACGADVELCSQRLLRSGLFINTDLSPPIAAAFLAKKRELVVKIMAKHHLRKPSLEEVLCLASMMLTPLHTLPRPEQIAHLLEETNYVYVGDFFRSEEESVGWSIPKARSINRVLTEQTHFSLGMNINPYIRQKFQQIKAARQRWGWRI